MLWVEPHAQPLPEKDDLEHKSLSLRGLAYTLRRNAWECAAISGDILSVSFLSSNYRHTKYSQCQGQASGVSITLVSHHTFKLLKYHFTWKLILHHIPFHLYESFTPEQYLEFKSRTFNLLSATAWPLLFPKLALDILPRPLPLHLRVLTEGLPH